MSVIEQQWYTYDRDKVEDLESLALELLEDDETVVKIGTDAQKLGRKLHFVTVLIFYRKGKGGRVLFTRERITRDYSLWEKLSTETWKSLEAAMYLENLLGARDRIEVHVDANEDTQYRSSDYVKQLSGMVMGQGFRCVLKPDAAASSHCADHVVKGKHIPGNQKRNKRNLKRRTYKKGN